MFFCVFWTFLQKIVLQEHHQAVIKSKNKIVQWGGGTPLYKEAGGPSGVRFWYVWGSICTLYIVFSRVLLISNVFLTCLQKIGLQEHHQAVIKSKNKIVQWGGDPPSIIVQWGGGPPSIIVQWGDHPPPIIVQ